MSNLPKMMGLPYLLYLTFAMAAFTFWALFFILVLGVFPFPVEPQCALEPAGCPPPAIWKQLLGIVAVITPIPLTVLLFIFFRRWVRRRFGLQDRR